GGFETWAAAGMEVDQIESITPDELAERMEEGRVNILDVRRRSEYDSEHLVVAENAPLDYINESMLKVKKNETTYVHCAGGYRSMIFVSILRARGYDQLIDISGGYKAIKACGKFATTNYVQPITEL
ncbi:MAG TPA: rhodanese-like domain-containing protein, partial [Flavisolibacter sp.]|nr:rhodanese-like domain-containing protein [Flavisolibacter sp.]